MNMAEFILHVCCNPIETFERAHDHPRIQVYQVIEVFGTDGTEESNHQT